MFPSAPQLCVFWWPALIYLYVD